MTERTEMEAAIEAILFVAAEPVPRARLLELFDEDERAQAAEALAAVLERYRGGDERGVMAEEVAGGVRFVTRPEMGAWLRRFFEVAAGSKLSMAALETLAIVAYRQPITGPEIQELRSVSSAAVLKTLLERRLVRIAGRKEVVGKPFLYATTREFLVHFGLNNLRDLPPLEEFEESMGSVLGGGVTVAAASGGGVGAAEGGPGGGVAAGGAAAGARMEMVEEDREERILREAAELEERAEERGEGRGEDEAADAGDRGVRAAGRAATPAMLEEEEEDREERAEGWVAGEELEGEEEPAASGVEVEKGEW